MLFNSLAFLIFFPIVTIGYFLLPHKHRWWWLLLASCVFYMFFIPAYILILLITILIDYWAGIKIEESQGKTRKSYLVISIISTCLVLVIFKYFNFFNNNFRGLSEMLGYKYSIPALGMILPIGLSFHTFQSLSYVVEVYRGNYKAERNFGIYSLYVMFYPQLVAGPIERPQNVLYQFYEKHNVDYENITRGLKQMAWGFFKKLVIADRLSPMVSQVYDHPNAHSGWEVVFATLLFAEQIYCDFSGYSDIAIGSAKVMGFDLMKNFNLPYSSKSISEFWTRWHISLSTWFRDYVYIPLGGNRGKAWKVSRNLLITFILSGFWHGANWTFIIWGGLNGFYLVFARATKKWRSNLDDIIGISKVPWLNNFVDIFLTCFLACFAWIFFRANTLADALTLIRNSTNLHASQLTKFVMGQNYISFYIAIGGVLVLEIIQAVLRRKNVSDWLSQKPLMFRWAVYIIFISVILNFGVFSNQGFIYFQF